MSSNRLLIVVNDARFFVSHRLEIAIHARLVGFDVHIATPSAGSELITEHGFAHHVIPLSRGGYNPFFELYTIWSLFRLMKKVRPNILHLVTIKSVLYGGIAARLAGIKAVVAAISGLGSVFISQSFRVRVLRMFVKTLYRLALGHGNLAVIFQNPDDQRLFVSENIIPMNKAILIAGSGVNLEEFSYVAEREGSPVIVMAARLLKDKGVCEFVEAADILHQQGLDVCFKLVGSPDPSNPASVSEIELDRWRKKGVVQILGQRADIASLFAEAHIVALPSYREGLPKVLIEAAACGRAVVTTNVPGCRDSIIPDVTGVLVPVKNAEALAAAFKSLIQDKALRRKLGQAGRDLAEREFDVKKVVSHHINLYQTLLARA